MREAHQTEPEACLAISARPEGRTRVFRRIGAQASVLRRKAAPAYWRRENCAYTFYEASDPGAEHDVVPVLILKPAWE